ncbi:MAG: hypothetical protein WAO07_16000 [Desulfobacterales bacterium]
MRPSPPRHRPSLRELAVRLGVDEATFERACSALTGDGDNARSIPRRAATAEPPRLNANDTPFQFALSHRTTGMARRLLSDPGHGFYAPGGDTSSKMAAIRRAFALWQAGSLFPLIASAARAFGSDAAAAPPRIPDAVLGVSLDGPGAAVYFRIDPSGAAASWTVLSQWVATQFSNGARVQKLVAGLAGAAHLVGVGIEGVDTRPGRLKIYWQLDQPLPLADIKAPFVGDPAIARFLALAVGEARIGLHALFFSTAFCLRTGDAVDGKIDICGHCVPRPLPAWQQIIDQVAAAHGLVSGDFAPSEAPRHHRDDSLTVEFVGMGLDRHHAYRLNVYFSEPAA